MVFTSVNVPAQHYCRREHAIKYDLVGVLYTYIGVIGVLGLSRQTVVAPARYDVF